MHSVMDYHDAFRILREILKMGQGPTPNYDLEHVWAFMDLLFDGPIGRKHMSVKLGLGEGSVRSIVRRALSLGLVETGRKGCRLTVKGESVVAAIKSRVRGPYNLNLGDLTVSSHDAVFIVSGMAERVGSGVALRDAALLAGARGATTMVYTHGILHVPAVSSSVARDYPDCYRAIMSLKPSDGDVIVAGTAEQYLKAELGARKAVLKLLGIEE